MTRTIGALVLGAALAGRGAAQEPGTAPALAIHISVKARTLWVIDSAGDTLFRALVAVGSGRTLNGDTRTWTFRTPLGETRVTAKQKEPLWVPPDWYYIELAKERRLKLERLSADAPIALRDGRTLLVRDGRLGVVGNDSLFRPFPAGRDVVVDRTLFVPPFGTDQRRIPGVLGPYRLLLANGIDLHGTPYKDSIGRPVTHGCIRLHDADITWLYENIAVGTSVIIR